VNKFENTSKVLSVICWHSSQVTKVWLVADKCHYNFIIGVVTKLFEPTFNILKRQALGYVINYQCSHRSTIISGKKQIARLSVQKVARKSAQKHSIISVKDHYQHKKCCSLHGLEGMDNILAPTTLTGWYVDDIRRADIVEPHLKRIICYTSGRAACWNCHLVTFRRLWNYIQTLEEMFDWKTH